MSLITAHLSGSYIDYHAHVQTDVVHLKNETRSPTYNVLWYAYSVAVMKQIAHYVQLYLQIPHDCSDTVMLCTLTKSTINGLWYAYS